MSLSVSPPDAASYADARALLAEIIRASFAPPPSASVADYAAEHRWLDNEGGGYVGRWDHRRAPYLVAPMEALSSPDYLTVALVKPGQCGGTSVAENWLLYSVGAAPADLLWYMQTEPAVQSYVKTRITPMIAEHAALRTALGARAIDDSLHHKNFGRMSVQFLAATGANLISKSAPRIVADEIDAYPESLGDVKALLDVRRQTYGRESKLFLLSHPDAAGGIAPSKWTRGVMAAYADSTRAVWYWPCPHCGAWSSPAPHARRHMRLEYPVDAPLDEVEAGARLVCPVNGCLIEDGDRRAMNLAGRWVADGEEIDADGAITGAPVKRSVAGFWVHGTMSPFVIGGIGALARARVKAERERDESGDDASLRQVMVKQWGEPYDAARRVGSLDAGTLAERAEPDLPLETVPQGVRFLTCAIDVQANRFELLWRGWGVGGESWVVAVETLPADPATSAEDWHRVLARGFETRFPLADGSGRRMRVRGLGFDAAGAPGVTQLAYSAWRTWRLAGKTRYLGQMSGRDVYSVIPCKGLAGPNARPLQVVYPDHRRADRQARAGGNVPLALFNANAFKDDLAGQLAIAEGALRVHFPGALCGNFPTRPRRLEAPHAWFEQLVAEQRSPSGAWQKLVPSARNEALDLMVLTHVVARLHGLSRIDWTRPPPWAAPWETNTSIETAPGDSAATLPAPEGAQSSPGSLTAPGAPSSRFRALIKKMA